MGEEDIGELNVVLLWFEMHLYRYQRFLLFLNKAVDRLVRQNLTRSQDQNPLNQGKRFKVWLQSRNRYT